MYVIVLASSFFITIVMLICIGSLHTDLNCVLTVQRTLVFACVLQQLFFISFVLVFGSHIAHLHFVQFTFKLNLNSVRAKAMAC